MTPWIKQLLVGLCGAALIATAATAFADREHRGKGFHGCSKSWMHDDKARAEFRAKRAERISTELGLNDAQKQKLSTFFDKLSEQHKAMMGDSKGRHERIRSLIKDESFDRERAQALLNEKAARLQSNGPKLIAAAADLFDSLNAEQQQKARELLERRHGHRDHRPKADPSG
ncbi:MAG: Spy/CpxP family protein refolding chaperone [Pseudomonadota bacterium]|nr:Spy/CpxP family protein refolding chaperone [Pseudomonadota bacterium]